MSVALLFGPLIVIVVGDFIVKLFDGDVCETSGTFALLLGVIDGVTANDGVVGVTGVTGLLLLLLNVSDASEFFLPATLFLFKC